MYKPIFEGPHSEGVGIQKLYRFPNNYGASVVRFKMLGKYGSFTNNENEWELGVVHFTGEDDRYEHNSSPITDRVLCHLLDREVEEILEKIERLPPLIILKSERNIAFD